MLEVRAGSRLHFGLMELGEGQPLRFGGLGLMTQHPALLVRCTDLDTIPPAHDEVARRIAELITRFRNEATVPIPAKFSASVASPIRFHCGLGFGTQLACSVAAGLEIIGDHWSERDSATDGWNWFAANKDRSGELALHRLAEISGRGKRSAIGLHGFIFGGLVLDRGYSAQSSDTPCVDGDDSFCRQRNSIATQHVTFPESWKIVLVIPKQSQPIYGQTELELIQAASRSPNRKREQMLALAQQCLAAARAIDFMGYVDALEHYTQLAAALFQDVQGGTFRGQAIEQAVYLARTSGLRAVGQSSWGPVVFGFAEDESSANLIADRISRDLPDPTWEVIVTGPAHGAQWRKTLEN